MQNPWISIYDPSRRPTLGQQVELVKMDNEVAGTKDTGYYCRCHQDQTQRGFFSSLKDPKDQKYIGQGLELIGYTHWRPLTESSETQKHQEAPYGQ